MPVFYFLVVLCLVLLWFLLSWVFKPLGKLVYRLWKDAKDAINEKE